MSLKQFLYSMAFIIALNLSATLPKGAWDYINTDSSRLPSSALSGLGHKLNSALKKNLVSQSNVKFIDGNAFLTLGSLLTKQQISSFCEQYENIELKFLSADMFVNGKPSELKITSSCSSGHKLGALLIPFSKINDLTVKPQTLNEVQTIKFKNVATEWPREWHLNNILALKKNGQLKVLLSAEDIFESNKQLKIELPN